MEWIDLSPLTKEWLTALIVGQLLWFARQWIVEQYEKRSRREVLREIQKLRGQVSHLASAIMETIPLTDQEKLEIQSIFDDYVG